jgi:hypothetical protein
MAGMRIASTDGAGWTVETVELTLTRRRTTRRLGGGPAPLGDGAQLCVTRNGHLIGYCLSPDDLLHWAWTWPGWLWSPGGSSAIAAGAVAGMTLTGSRALGLPGTGAHRQLHPSWWVRQVEIELRRM